MATRRMFSKTIIDSDEFLEMPVSARLLYYDLGMRADDDGFVNPKRIMKFTNSTDDDLKVLLAKKYVLNFENKVLVIRDWKINNFIRPDRYTPTIYKEYLKRLQITETNQYQLNSGIPFGIPPDIPLVDAGKDRLGKDRLGNTPSPNYLKEIPLEDIQEFIKRFDMGEKQLKSKAESLYLYCEAKGKRYKNYRAFLLNALKKDFPERQLEKVAPKNDITPEQRAKNLERLKKMKSETIDKL